MDDDVAAAIMDATHRALCEHGYATVTMRDIAEEWGKSTAALHYHYDGKRALLLAFLDHLYDRYVDRLVDPEGERPAERLHWLLDTVLQPPEPEDHPHEAFATAILELKAQAPYDDGIRERMAAFDALLVDAIETHVEAGIEAGQFRGVDPADTARFLATAIDGALTKEVAIRQDLSVTRRMLGTYVETQLVRDDHETRLERNVQRTHREREDQQTQPERKDHSTKSAPREGEKPQPTTREETAGAE